MGRKGMQGRKGGEFSNVGDFGQGTEYGRFRALVVLVTGYPMSLDAEQVRRVAELARLAVTAEDLPVYAGELSNILALVDQLQAADTAGVEAMAHPLNMVQRLRPDEVSESPDREAFQALAPAAAEGHYLVPRVIE